jgi:signal transduction histidine kinase
MATERGLAARRAGETEQATYVSTVAHELRTPLTALSGYLDLILDGQVDDDAVIREFLERGRSIVGSMANLIGDLLELPASSPARWCSRPSRSRSRRRSIRSRPR